MKRLAPNIAKPKVKFASKMIQQVQEWFKNTVSAKMIDDLTQEGEILWSNQRVRKDDV